MESMHPLKWLRELRRNQRGNAIIVCAATLPLVIGSAAIGVDTIQVSLAKRQLQRAADSAAIAGAYARIQNHNVNTAVTRDLTFNNDVALSAAPTIQNAPAAGPFAGDTLAVRVVLSAQRSVPFMSFFTGSNMAVTTEATARAVFQGEYCLVALEQTGTGIDIGGSATVDLDCGMISNSTSNSAVLAGGGSTVRSSPVAAVGGVPASANYAAGTVRLPFSPRLPDPYGSLPMLPVPAGCPNQALRIQPNDPAYTLSTTAGAPGYMGNNTWCFAGMEIKGTLNIPANARIIVNGGELDFGSQATVNATSGVTFFLTYEDMVGQPSRVAQLKLNAGVTLNMVAPDSGPYSGVLMYQDRRAPDGSSHINGNASTTLRGSWYFPSRTLVFNGTAGMNTQCMQLIGRRLAFGGNSRITNTCPANSGSDGWDAIFVRLVA
jgi:Flp pilus assembly protein TadG